VSDEQLQAFQAFLDAAREAWNAITTIAREALSTLSRWYWQNIRPIQRILGLLPQRQPTIMTRKIRRYALMTAQRR
jgi:hypothetical protein